MAEEKATGAPALDTNIETGGFDEKRGQAAPPTHAPKAPVAEDEEPDEDMDALIEDLESEDGHAFEDEEETQPGGGRVVPEDQLQTDSRVGLTEAEVINRRRKWGLNQMKEERENMILKFLMFFVGPIQFVMEAAAVLAAGLEDWIDFGVICALLLLNACVGFVQEFQAGSIVEELKKTLALKAVVLRDGTLKEVEAPEVVPGDILQVEEGTIIPADGRFVTEGCFVQVDQSAITGESLAVDKHAGDNCYASSAVKRGEAFVIVTATGDNTFVGRAAALVSQSAGGTGHFTEVLNGIGTILLVLVVATLLVVWVSSFYRSNGIVDILRFTLAITIVGVPVGLPAVVTTTMAVGAAYLAKKQAIVQKLSAIESLAGVEILCSDKTGTLTQNKMNLTNFWNERLIEINPYDKGTLTESFPEKYQDIIRQALACNGSATLVPYVGSKTEIALLEFLQNKGEDYEALRKHHVPNSATKYPFSSQRKRMTTVLENVENGTPGKKRMHIKGASEIILETCSHFYSFEEDRVIPMTEVLKRKIEEEINGMASKALRTLCVAYKEINGNEDLTSRDDKNVYEIEKSNFILLGVLGIRDILRKEVKEAVRRCKLAGIKVRMVTGDNAITARAIALECGIIDPKDEHSIVMTGPEFIEATGGIICKNCKTKDCDCPRDKATAKKKNKEVRVDTIANGAAFDKIYPHFDVMARSRPEDKYALVTGLLERGAVVAVTGDGTNDAPALKKADVGFAMNTGTDVAKEAADIVLLDDNFASIVKAAMWGRNIYDNIKKFLQFQLTVNVVAVFMTFISAAVLQEELLTAIQLLWVNLIMDTLASLALATEPPTEDLLNRKPHNRNEYIISREMMKHILGQSAYQFTIMMILAFTGEKWIPEYLGHDLIEGCGDISNPASFLECFKYYSPNGKTVRCGRPYFVSHAGDDYKRYEDEIGPSRHYTVIFNTFVCMQIFNFMNARKIHEERNIFQGICRNPFFVGIVVLITGIQLIVGNLGNVAFHVSKSAMDPRQWLICLAFGAGGLIWGFILRLIPINKLCPKAGNKQTDPLQSSSKILSVKRSHNEDTLHRKFSSINRPDAKGGSITKVQYHAVNN